MEKKKLTQTKQAQNMARHAKRKQHAKRARKLKVIRLRAFRESNHTQTKIMKRTSGAPQKLSNGGVVKRVKKNGAPIHSMRTTAARNPKNELEAATQRFVDLYDFAP